MYMEIVEKDGKRYKVVYSRFVTRNGKRVYHPNGKVYRFLVEI